MLSCSLWKMSGHCHKNNYFLCFDFLHWGADIFNMSISGSQARLHINQGPAHYNPYGCPCKECLWEPKLTLLWKNFASIFHMLLHFMAFQFWLITINVNSVKYNRRYNITTLIWTRQLFPRCNKLCAVNAVRFLLKTTPNCDSLHHHAI